MLLRTLGTTLLGNILTGKGINRGVEGKDKCKGINRDAKGIIRSVGSKSDF